MSASWAKVSPLGMRLGMRCAVLYGAVATWGLAPTMGLAAAPQRDQSQPAKTQNLTVDTLTLVSEKTLNGRLMGVSADGRGLQFRAPDGTQADYPGDDVVSVQIGGAEPPADAPATHTAPASGSRQILLADGESRLWVKALTLAEGGEIELTGGLVGAIKAPLEAVGAIRFVDPTAAAELPADFARRFEEAVAARKAPREVFFGLDKTELVELGGQLKSISANEVKLLYEGESYTLTVAKLYGVVLAALKAPTLPSAVRGPAVAAELVDGSRLVGRLVRVVDAPDDKNPTEAFVVAVAGLGELTVPRQATRRLTFASGRLVRLADLTPVKAIEHQPYFATPGVTNEPGLLKVARNKPVRGGERLRLGGVEYETGLGVHSYCELTYDLAGQYEKFTAVIGIDDATAGRGHVVFIVLLDGREYKRWPLGGRDKPVAIDIPLEGVMTMTLTVDYGEGLDISDWADWAAARLLKRKPQP